MSIFPAGSTPPETAAGALALKIRCDGDLLERKLRALRSHASQVEPLVAAVGVDTFAPWWAEEAFVDAETVIDAAEDHRPGAENAPSMHPTEEENMSPGWRKPSDAVAPASRLLLTEEASRTDELPFASTARTLSTGNTGVDQRGFCDGCHAQGASRFRRPFVYDVGSDPSMASTATSGRLNNRHPLVACPPRVTGRRRIA
jgi:hypothetical protein